MAIHDETIIIGVKPELDHRAVQKLSKDLQGVYKNLGKMTLDFGKVSKQSQTNIKELAHLSSSAEAFGKVLSKSTRDAAKGFKGLKDELEDATSEAVALQSAAKSAPTGGGQQQLMKEASLAAAKVSKLNKQIENQTKQHKSSIKEIKDTAIQFDGFKKNLQSFSKFKSADVMKGMGNALQVAMKNPMKGLSMAAMALGKGARGKAASKGMAMGGSGDMAGFGKMAKALTAATAAMAGVAAVVGGMWIAIKAASDHMSSLNKAMLSGAGLAGDMGVGVEGTKNTIDDLRQAAMNTRWAMLKFGGDSEKSLETVAAFAREASGSIVRTASQLEEMGGGNMERGLQSFAQNAIAYGKALGMEAKDVATTMGMFVSEIGIAADNVQGTMSNIVKMAATSQMPVYKFMDIFRQVTPHLNLYINRIEELTGVIKLLSRSMSAKSVKEFMNAFSDGFEKVDFKQRVKMAAVIGVKNTSDILMKSFKADAKAISKQFKGMGSHFQEDLEKAISGGDTKKVSSMMAMAGGSGKGISGAAIEAAGDKTRMAKAAKKGQGGDLMQTAHSLRGAGFAARIELTEKFAAKFTKSGDLSGLDEHIVKQLGISEQQYAAMLKFKDAMGVHTSSVQKIGRTSDKVINDTIKNMLEGEGKEDVSTDEKFEDVMKKMSPKKMEGYIKAAAVMQMEAEEKSDVGTREMAVMSYNAVASMDEKLTSLIHYMLQKIYQILEPILGVLQESFNWLSGSSEEKKTQKILMDQVKAVKEAGGGEKGVAHIKGVTDKLSKLSSSGASTKEILSSMGGGMNISMLGKTQEADMKKVSDWAFGTEKSTTYGAGQSPMTGGTSESKSDIFMKALKAGDTVVTDKMLKEMDPKKMIQFLGSIETHLAAAGVTSAEMIAAGGGLKKAGVYEKPLEEGEKKFIPLKSKREKAAAKARGTDERAVELVEIEMAKDYPGAVKGGEDKDKDKKKDSNLVDKIKKDGDASIAIIKKKMGKKPDASAAAGGGSLADRIGKTDKISNDPKALQETMMKLGLTQKEAAGLLKDKAEEQVKEARKQTDAAKKTKEGLKKIGFDKSLVDPIIKDSTLKAFRIALTEFAFILAKMMGEIGMDEKDKEDSFTKAMGSDHARTVMEKGGTLQDIIKHKSYDEKGMGRLWHKKLGSKQLGGSIMESGLYSMHKGEHVIPSNQVPGATGGGGPVTINATFDIRSNNPEAVADIVNRKLHEAFKSSR